MKGDFIGFSFCGVNSSDLGILRVSDGSRYNEYLLPNSQDNTTQIPGGDGTYYFGTYYTNRPISIQIAFDDLSEQNFRRLQQTFSAKKIGKLIFEEAPYKYYMAKVTGAPQLKYICFGREGEPRVYKGEGTIQFTCYYPYAKSVALCSALIEASNKEEWRERSGLPDTAPITSGTNISIKNVGDIDMEWRAIYQVENKALSLQRIKAETVGELNFSFSEGIKDEDQFIAISSKTNLVEGLDANKERTRNLYNKAITSGSFFKIPADNKNYSFVSTGAKCTDLKYEYIYY